MKGLTCLATLALTTCANTVERPHYRLVETIEEKVRLPGGANSLKDYARYYAMNGSLVIGVYLKFVEVSNRHYDLPIGKTRWLDDYHDLPDVQDGGCSIVNVRFNAKTGSGPEASCNGIG